MAGDEQKPDPSLLKLQYPSMLSDASLECNRTLSFKAWLVERAASKEGVPRQSSKTQTPPPGLLMIKDEPWQGPPGFPPDDYLNPAARDLTGPRNKAQTLPPSKETIIPKRPRSLQQEAWQSPPGISPNEHLNPPNELPFARGNPSPRPSQFQELKLLPKTIVPKRPHPLQGPPGISRDEHLNLLCNKAQTHPPSNDSIIPKRPRSLQGPPGISRNEHLNPQNELPFSRGNPSPRPSQFQELKLPPNAIVPTGPRSFLKRKAMPEKPVTPSPPPSKMRKSAENLVCHICKRSCSSALVMQQHLRGRKHKAKISFMKMKRKSTSTNTTTASNPRCDLCEIWCSDVGALQIHFKGQKHKAKVQELHLCKERGGQKSSKAPIVCEVCGVSCMNQDSFEQHLKGRQHGVKQDLKRRGLL